MYEQNVFIRQTESILKYENQTLAQLREVVNEKSESILTSKSGAGPTLYQGVRQKA